MPKANLKYLALIMSLIVSSIQAHAGSVFIYGNESLDLDDDTLILDANNDSLTSDITIQFGQTLAEQIYWDNSNTTFVFTDDVDFQGNQITDFRIENQPTASQPACAAAADGGRAYYNTDTNQVYLCNGTAWTSTITKMVQTRNTDTATNLNTNGTFTQIPLTGTTDFIDADTYTINGNGIEVETDGKYLAQATVHFTANNNRVNMQMQFFVDGVSQGVTGASAYIRNGSGHNESSITIHQWLELSANEVVTVRTQREGGGGNATMQTAGDSNLSLMLPPQ